jgi:5-methylcytosine-specific restriction endonuclease McrA
VSSYGGRKVARLRAEVIAKYGRRCHICKLLIVGKVSVDHVIPRSHGGTDHISNLRPAHLRCNKRRGARPLTHLTPHPADVERPNPSRAWFESFRDRGRKLRTFRALFPQETRCAGTTIRAQVCAFGRGAAAA